MKKLISLILFASLFMTTQAQTTTTQVYLYSLGWYTVNSSPYPGTASVVIDGDLVRVPTSTPLPGFIVEVEYREWYINPYGGAEEMSEGLLYIDASLLSTNAGIGAFSPQIRIPMQNVYHNKIEGGIGTQYLASIKGDTAFYNGRKYGFSNKWSLRVRWTHRDDAAKTITVYQTDWLVVNFASLPPMEASQFYAGTNFNPVQPSLAVPKKVKGQAGGPVKK